jgi:hypothetical protein
MVANYAAYSGAGRTQLRHPGAVRERRAPTPVVNAVIEASRFQILPVSR